LGKGSFYGDESGGRIISFDDRRVLFSVGDFSQDGLNGGPNLAQDRTGSYGKTILIDLSSGRGEVYTTGHRNPQGLYAGPDGAVWSTEHGPRGGDELNLLVRGANYGWPFATYGTHMLSHNWPLSANPGSHDGFQTPIYAWLPDIGVSNMTSVEGDLFRAWKHDLLIGSLKRTLWRVRVREGHVVYAEPIEIRGTNARIRDVMEDKDGRIVLMLDGGGIAILEPAPDQGKVADGIAGSDSMRGQLLFARCRGCHEVKDGTAHGIGPDLSGISGRPIAGATGFEYSDALRRLSGPWSDERLDQFLASPQEFVPGTAMAFEGIRDSADRAKVVDFLKTLR
jgi:cytochrome c2